MLQQNVSVTENSSWLETYFYNLNYSQQQLNHLKVAGYSFQYCSKFSKI